MAYVYHAAGEKVNTFREGKLPLLYADPPQYLMVKNSPEDRPGERLGALISAARERAGITQEAVERELNLMGIKYTREGFRSLENGEVELPKRPVIRGIAKVLDLNMADILEAAGYLEAADRDPIVRLDRLRQAEAQMETVLRLMAQGVEKIEAVRQSLEEQLGQT